MSATPGKPRQSGIPGPGRVSGIPTPGRSRASSTVVQQNASQPDVEYMSRAFAEAIKANDPSQHRSTYISSASSTSLSPQSASISQSGRRSVTGRPSSSASTSSTSSFMYSKEQTKTPASIRPSSRHSDATAKSAARTYDIGDNVRIESLGYEGTVKYVGEIEGKPGLWAGVQLGGGFTGKGKNNGSVNGVQYFTCPDKCGVFVATTKLSPPTVGIGAIHRPSSVASSRGGRITPALSGRITPSSSTSITGSRTSTSTSLFNGRVTPSTSGRVTPAISSGRATPGVTPASRVRRPLAKSTASKPESAVPLEKFTAGSRASMYMSMTAKQLSSRDSASTSPIPRRIADLESPTRSHSSLYNNPRNTASPTRPTGSPFTTPKPSLSGRTSGIGGVTSKNRPSLSTPRARIPSAIAMPPPVSPMSSRSLSLNDRPINDATDNSGLDIHGRGQERSHQRGAGDTITLLTRPESVASVRSSIADDRAHIEQPQSHIDGLERDKGDFHIPDINMDHLLELQTAHQERDDAISRIVALEASLAKSKGDLEEHRALLRSLEEDQERIVSALEAENKAKESGFVTLQVEMYAESAAAEELRLNLANQEAINQQKEVLLSSKEKFISSLELKIAAVTKELNEEKIELGSQIEELRSAGQETIALYEERLSAADSQRWDFEHKITALETRLQNAQKTVSPAPAPFSGSSAAEIDNETLREQLVHLQRKISTMEDTIEDVQATAEREEVAMRGRIKRLKDKEDTMRKELSDGRKEVERMLKSEANARSRVEEIEEALRESTVALENARAEVEGLRAELANLDGLVANSSGGDLSSRVAEAAHRAANEKSQYIEEIAQLQQKIEQHRLEQTAPKGYSSVQTSELIRENTLLKEKLSDQETKLNALLQSLDETSRELESLKKKSNRDASINNGLQDGLRPVPSSPSSKHDLSTAREEITGLKHIIQELQKENVAALQRIKLLESDNELLLTEVNQLRQEVHILEDNLDKSLDQEETPVNGSHEESPSILREQKTRLELDQEQLRKRLVDTEMKTARTIHDLNKEISELEALVESKIYREDELEQELERLREKLARQHRKSSKSSTDTLDGRGTVGGRQEEPVCEICERPGHDIFSCAVLNKDAPVSLRRPTEELYCEECESRGHLAADCPHSLDVF